MELPVSVHGFHSRSSTRKGQSLRSRGHCDAQQTYLLSVKISQNILQYSQSALVFSQQKSPDQPLGIFSYRMCRGQAQEPTAFRLRNQGQVDIACCLRSLGGYSMIW